MSSVNSAVYAPQWKTNKILNYDYVKQISGQIKRAEKNGLKQH